MTVRVLRSRQQRDFLADGETFCVDFADMEEVEISDEEYADIFGHPPPAEDPAEAASEASR